MHKYITQNCFYKLALHGDLTTKYFYSNQIRNHNLTNLLLKMPKEPKLTENLQKVRSKLKEKGQKYVPGTVTLKVLGSGAKGAPRSLYVFTDQSRYLFNCGEGTQRLAHEHKMRLSKLEQIFVTYPSWENIGGLPGIALTIQDVGVPKIMLHGPAGLDEIFPATRRFVVLKDLQVSMAACTPTVPFSDPVMSVDYVPIRASDSGVRAPTSPPDAAPTSESDDDTDYYEHERKRKMGDGGGGGGRDAKRSRLVADVAMAYVCRLQDRPGSLSLERCVDRRVPAGPMLGQLKAGQDVTLKDGTVVRSEDVCLPGESGPVFIVVECPTVGYLDALLREDSFVGHQATARAEADVACLVVHFSPQSVVQHEKYQEWMDRFSPSTRHLVLNDSNQCMGSVAVHRIQHKLHLLHGQIFPLLAGNTVGARPVIGNGTPVSKPNTSPSLTSAIEGRTLLNFHLRPFKGLDSSEELRLEPSTYTAETLAVDQFPETLASLVASLGGAARQAADIADKQTADTADKQTADTAGNQAADTADKQTADTAGKQTADIAASQMADSSIDRVAAERIKQKVEGQVEQMAERRMEQTAASYPRLVFLGTGSCIPNKTRNTSAILLRVNASTNIMLDCGEGTYGQLVRYYGREVGSVLRGLKAIYVSHLHADHHIGLIGLLKGRSAALGPDPSDPVFLIAPKQIRAWLNVYHRTFEPILQHFQLIHNGALYLGDHKLEPAVRRSLLNRLGLADVNTVLVNHCPNAFGVAFAHRDWKIAYSGDTMPCQEFVKLGQDSDVLIHEATMEDELEMEARLKLHSTTSQAVEVGRRMRAKFTLLTHFSQRYAKLPRLDGDVLGAGVGIAFDNMEVSLEHLAILPRLYPCLKLMFADHHEELEQKAVRRLLKREREKLTMAAT